MQDAKSLSIKFLMLEIEIEFEAMKAMNKKCEMQGNLPHYTHNNFIDLRDRLNKAMDAIEKNFKR